MCKCALSECGLGKYGYEAEADYRYYYKLDDTYEIDVTLPSTRLPPPRATYGRHTAGGALLALVALVARVMLRLGCCAQRDA